MDERERDLVFESAIEDFDAGLHGLAARTLRQLVEDGSNVPEHLSHCGLVIATAEGSFEEGVALCRRAVDSGPRPTPQLYLNLARVLLVAGRRREAVECLSKGLTAHPGDLSLRRELQHLVPRRRPTFHSLPRKHPLNKYAGIARTVGRRLWITFVPRVRRVSPPRAPSRGARG